MYVVVATDGSTQSHDAARFLRTVVDPTTVTAVGVLAVISPLAAVPFAAEDESDGLDQLSFRRSAERAVTAVADGLRDWGPKVTTHVRSGSPASEIVKMAREKDAGLIVLASRSSRASAVLMGSVAHRVLSHATCPVLVHRKGGKPKPPRRR